MEEAFWGQHYRDWVWVVTSEIERCMSVCVCVCGMQSMFKKESGAALNDRLMDKQRTQREKQYLESAKARNKEREWKESEVGGFRSSESQMTKSKRAMQATISLQWDTLEVAVRSVSTTVLTFSTWLASLVFLSAAFELPQCLCMFSHTAFPTHSRCC